MNFLAADPSKHSLSLIKAQNQSVQNTFSLSKEEKKKKHIRAGHVEEGAKAFSQGTKVNMSALPWKREISNISQSIKLNESLIQFQNSSSVTSVH